MRNLSFKIISPSALSGSMSVNLRRVSILVLYTRSLSEVFFSPCSMLANLALSFSTCSLESYKNTSNKVTVMGTPWLPVGRRAISCSLFSLASHSSHSSPKVLESPKTRVFESGVSQCLSQDIHYISPSKVTKLAL